MATTTVGDLIAQHPANPVHDTCYISHSNKQWTKSYPPIAKLNVWTRVRGEQTVDASFDDAFLGEYDDETLRLNQPAQAPNYRSWYLQSEEDGIIWFHTEVSNVVLAAWAKYPELLQVSHEKPLLTDRVNETVDVAYSVKHGGQRAHVTIGEFKRGLIEPQEWQGGKLLKTQEALSQELRGYADRYACPQVFCFDHSTFLVLQFRASNRSQIRDANCEVDCWVLPRQNPLGTTLRYMLYRLLVQGFRRCQGMWPASGVSLYQMPPHRREFFNGQPLWKIDGRYYSEPWGHRRQVDRNYGAFYWTDGEGSNSLGGENGAIVWDTDAFWELEQDQQYAGLEDDTVDEEGIYGL